MDQALLLAERSLETGRAIGDRFGQTITLQLQLQIWQEARSTGPCVAVMALLEALYRSMGQADQARRFSQVLEEIRRQIPAEALRPVLEDPESVRQAGAAEAAQRLEKSGRNLFAVP